MRAIYKYDVSSMIMLKKFEHWKKKVYVRDNIQVFIWDSQFIRM